MDNFINKFHSISITGRYIYGYLCLLQVIKAKQLKPLPIELEKIIIQFVSTNSFDLWQEEVDLFIPSRVIDENNDLSANDILPEEIKLNLKKYYLSQPKILIDIIESVIWLGMSNLYGEFKSEITLPYITDIIKLLINENIELPDFNLINKCSISQRKGWGDITVMDNFLQ